jgi:tetratricopeptide (TPR) repeat protein
VYDAATYDPDNPYVYVLRGEIAYVQDNYYRAQEQWTKALQISPQLYEIRLKLERLKSEKEREGNFNIREIENFRLKFEGLENQQVTDAAGEILRQAYREVGQDYGLYPQAVVPVIIYPSSTLKELDYFPDWAAGTYDGKIRFGEDLGKTPLRMKAVLYHEYTHAVVHILGGMNVPLWLNEGVAEYEARKFKKATERTQRRKMLLQAVRNNTLFTIEQLGGLDLTKLAYLSPNRIELVYAQSESFVTYIIGRMSLYEVKNLLVRLGAGNGIHKAVKDVLFVDLEVLERDWIDSLQQEREQH